jgi:hypothetical protein
MSSVADSRPLVVDVLNTTIRINRDRSLIRQKVNTADAGTGPSRSLVVPWRCAL